MRSGSHTRCFGRFLGPHRLKGFRLLTNEAQRTALLLWRQRSAFLGRKQFALADALTGNFRFTRTSACGTHFVTQRNQVATLQRLAPHKAVSYVLYSVKQSVGCGRQEVLRTRQQRLGNAGNFAGLKRLVDQPLRIITPAAQLPFQRLRSFSLGLGHLGRFGLGKLHLEHGLDTLRRTRDLLELGSNVLQLLLQHLSSGFVRAKATFFQRTRINQFSFCAPHYFCTTHLRGCGYAFFKHLTAGLRHAARDPLVEHIPDLICSLGRFFLGKRFGKQPASGRSFLHRRSDKRVAFSVDLVDQRLRRRRCRTSLRATERAPRLEVVNQLRCVHQRSILRLAQRHQRTRGAFHLLQIV